LISSIFFVLGSLGVLFHWFRVNGNSVRTFFRCGSRETPFSGFPRLEFLITPYVKRREMIIHSWRDSRRMRGVADIFVSVLLRLNYVSAGIAISQKTSQSMRLLLELIWSRVLSAESRFWQFRGDMPVGGDRVV
jgi:hypothetical protein